jgi:hypothetical protein
VQNGKLSLRDFEHDTATAHIADVTTFGIATNLSGSIEVGIGVENDGCEWVSAIVAASETVKYGLFAGLIQSFPASC